MQPTPLALLAAAALLAACASDSATTAAEPIADTAAATPVATVPAVTTTSADCAAGATVLTAGQAVVVGSGSALCVAGGTAGAEYALVAFNGSTAASRRAALSVTATGVTAVTSASLAAALTGSAGLARLGDGATAGLSAARVPSRALDLRLHAIAARELAPRIAGARQWYAARSAGSARSAGAAARRSVIARTVAVGDVVSLNANADDACTNAEMRAGRVAAVSSRAVVVADTLNPSSGYADADYQSIAATFDSLVDPVDRAAFGDPTDIDDNGRVVLFFTRAVNELTPANSGWYVGGFFWARDIFPTTASDPAGACAASNAAEMFYLMVPDPRGTINGNVFSKSEVTDIVTATVAHEYQHLINASRRLYVNTAAGGWEETWLDEGLSHVAEELVFYKATGLAPRQNVTAATLRRSAAYVNAFNEFAVENFGRLESFLTAPAAGSPYADDDSLSTRGATWSFLRYAADHQGTSDGTVWRRLVNSSTTGLANLRAVFGTDLTSLLRDWATSLLLDDVTGADARFQSPSWGYRSIFAALEESGAYPLSATTLADGTGRAVSLAGGGAAYLPFGVAAGAAASVSWGALPAGVQLTLVRTR